MVSLDGGSACKVDDVTALPSHIQDGGYTLLWQRYDNNKMAAMRFLHLQQYSRRLNLFFIMTKTAYSWDVTSASVLYLSEVNLTIDDDFTNTLSEAQSWV